MTVAAAREEDRLERWTSASRSRVAEELFLGRPARTIDRVLSRAYFEVAARRWAGYNDDGHHLAAFTAGLERYAAPSRVLDVGTGTGESAALVARRHPTAEVVAVDTSARMLRLARARHADVANVSFRRCSAARLPFGDATFDLVTCVNAVPDPVELRRVLRSGGTVLAAATTLGVRDESSDWVRRWVDLGFRRVATDEVEGGSWERFER